MKIGVNRPAMADRDLADILAALINVDEQHIERTGSGQPFPEHADRAGSGPLNSVSVWISGLRIPFTLPRDAAGW